MEVTYQDAGIVLAISVILEVLKAISFFKTKLNFFPYIGMGLGIIFASLKVMTFTPETILTGVVSGIAATVAYRAIIRPIEVAVNEKK